MDKEALSALFEKYVRKLRITPAWDVKLEFVEDPAWRRRGQQMADARGVLPAFSGGYL